MTKFSKEEIELCKKIAEKKKKLIRYGDWYIYTDNKVQLHFHQSIGELSKEYGGALNFIPLWTLSDCLEWLREKDWKVVELREDWIGNFWVIDLDRQDTKYEPIHSVGKTPLEACLKAVLAVLEASQ